MDTACLPSSAIAIRRFAPAALRKGSTKSSAAVVLAAGALSGGLLLPLGVFGWIAAAAALCGLGVRLGAAPLARARAEAAIRHARQAHRRARERALPYQSTERLALAELTTLVDEVEREDAELAERLELESLLDRYVTLTVAHRQALRAVAMSERAQLEKIRDELRADPECDARRLELCERRLRCHGRCEATVDRLADELAITDHLIRLVAQRTACPDELVPDSDTIEHRLVELDGDDAARLQLASELQ